MNESPENSKNVNISQIKLYVVSITVVIFFSGEHKCLKFSQKNYTFIILFILITILTWFIKEKLINIKIKSFPPQYKSTINLK